MQSSRHAIAACSAILSHPRSLNRVLELLYHPLASPLSLPRSLASHTSSRARPPLMPSASSCYCSRRLQLDRCCTRLAEPGAPARPRPSFAASRTSPELAPSAQFAAVAACQRSYVAGPLQATASPDEAMHQCAGAHACCAATPRRRRTAGRPSPPSSLLCSPKEGGRTSRLNSRKGKVLSAKL